MRLLIDQCLAPLIARELAALGHDAVHVRSLGMSRATDVEIIDFAEREDRVIISADSDFGKHLAMRQATKPSLVFLREDAPATARGVIDLLARNLGQLEPMLRQGAIATVRADRIRVRELPLH